MGLEQIVPAIALIAVLILVLPNFLRSNSEKKQLFKKFGSTKTKTAIKAIAGTIWSRSIF